MAMFPLNMFGNITFFGSMLNDMYNSMFADWDISKYKRVHKQTTVV